MNTSDSFDLLSARTGRVAEAVLIISPYVEASFFRHVARQLRPKSIHVVIDDGCRREDLETVTSALQEGGHKRPPLVRLGSARGLVHLKLFYIRWRTDGGRKAASLVFGSANATRQGFDGNVNAELLAVCDLTASAHAATIQWCESVIDATKAKVPVDVPGERHGVIAKGMTLRLPAITVGRTVSQVSDFDLWIQRGHLLSEYKADPSFLFVPIPLVKPLPAGEQSRAASSVGFDVRPTRSIRHRYIDDGSAEHRDHAAGTEQGNWRRKLFTPTQLGEWCSRECYQARRSEFLRKGHERRTEALQHLQELASKKLRKAARRTFVNKVAELWKLLGDQAPDHLRGSDELDRAHYRDTFDRKIARDLDLAADSEFRRRYVTGFELVEVPRFRNDVAGWRSFVHSLAQQLALDEVKGRSQSKLVRAIREAVEKECGNASALLEPRELLDLLRGMMQGDVEKVGAAQMLLRYHEV
ncbi:hypothetical protein C8J46_10951 [Sphingomonas sp. PP-F2F-A104-K0414]|uniref:hypothetical protein n=1 Tax=Sphingomonas sp. PP-F2F-A104-K0414 TaxID=2135661 RepID=UPI00104E8B54|nr:hypothetical protein [Sphingomonas sp. PP-F2F-A104-K0414]TCP96356.1 hypothetical protein C8J46_10951 [Sphingomonas sp. PP-F2F-A104-K0414]